MAHYTLTAEQLEYADRPQLNANTRWLMLTGASILPSFIIFYAVWTPQCLYLWTENGCLKATQHIIITVKGIIDPEIIVTTGARQEIAQGHRNN